MAAPIAIVQKPRTCFFTTEEEDNELINQWLEYYNLDYQVFYASFLNQAIKICQMAKQDPASLSMTDNALKWVLEDFPAQMQGFLDGLEAYKDKEWTGGVCSGTINLEGGRKATESNISRAHSRLAGLLFSLEARKSMLEKRSDLLWLVAGRAAKRHLQKKNKRNASVLEGLDLGDDTEDEDEDEE